MQKQDEEGQRTGADRCIDGECHLARLNFPSALPRKAHPGWLHAGQVAVKSSQSQGSFCAACSCGL